MMNFAEFTPIKLILFVCFTLQWMSTMVGGRDEIDKSKVTSRGPHSNSFSTRKPLFSFLVREESLNLAIGLLMTIFHSGERIERRIL